MTTRQIARHKLLPRQNLARKVTARHDLTEVRLLGLEPRTYGLKVRCSTD